MFNDDTFIHMHDVHMRLNKSKRYQEVLLQVRYIRNVGSQFDAPLINNVTGSQLFVVI
jgi:hypothetical protein